MSEDSSSSTSPGPEPMTPDEFIAECMTVGDLVKALSELPQDALVVKFAGGDCDGYNPVSKKEFTATSMFLRSGWNTYEYHGPFDDAEEKRHSNRHWGTKYIKKIKAVKL
jgi:hypothetical protein